MVLTLVRAVVRQGIARGCQTFIIREGWEGLVRGNDSEPTPAATRTPSTVTSPALGPQKSVSFASLPPSKQLELDPHALDDDPHLHHHHHHHNHEDDLHGHAVNYTDPNWITPLSDAPLSFGFGELLKDGAGEGDLEELAALGAQGLALADQRDEKARSLKGKYIVRVGWDDVRGWLGEGGTLIGSSRCPSCELTDRPSRGKS